MAGSTKVAAISEVSGEETTSFGFEEVPRAEKTRRVRAVFDSVARRYDLMNDLMSGGVHRLWKRTLIDLIRPRAGQCLIDVAGGTGDIASRFLAATEGQAAAVICDASLAMLTTGRNRRAEADGSLRWSCAAAEALPFPAHSFDTYTIAFGLRNVTDIATALTEARRVLKPLGRFACLEFSQVQWPLLGAAYDRYSFKVLPQLGRVVARDADAYRYLAESIRRFPPQQELAAMIRDAGFERVQVHNLSGGIAAIHSAWRI